MSKGLDSLGNRYVTVTLDCDAVHARLQAELQRIAVLAANRGLYDRDYGFFVNDQPLQVVMRDE